MAAASAYNTLAVYPDYIAISPFLTTHTSTWLDYQLTELFAQINASAYYSAYYLCLLLILQELSGQTALTVTVKTSRTFAPSAPSAFALGMSTMADLAAKSANFTYATLCPPPLSISKKPRRAAFRQRILPRSDPCKSSNQYIFGPLDDIINGIKSDLWDSPPHYSFASASFNWDYLSTAPSIWAVTPLPLSRNPSDQPPTIRKTRHSRSSASDSSMGDRVTGSRNGSHEEAMRGGPVGSVPWPLLDTLASCESVPTAAPHSSDCTTSSQGLTAQRVLQDSVHNRDNGPEVKKRHPSRLRLFTNGFPRWRRLGTGNASTGSTIDSLSLTANTLRAPPSNQVESAVLDEEVPSDAAVEAYIRNHARKYVYPFLLFSSISWRRYSCQQHH